MIKLMNLCPHESNILIKDIVQKMDHIVLVKLLLNDFKDAIESFHEKALINFDAHVGENLCQIRAYKIYQLSKSTIFQKKLADVQCSIEKSLETLNIYEEHYNFWLKRHKSERPTYIKKSLHLSDFFQQMSVEISFEKDVFFVFLSYFLCKYCVMDEEKIPFTIDYQRIQLEFKLSRSFSKRLVHYYQKHLAELSCDFIFKLLSDLHEFSDIKSILKKLHKKADEGRMVLPCFLVTKVIVQHMIQAETELLLICSVKIGLHHQLVSRLFKGNKVKNSFELCARDVLHHDLAYLVFYGEHEQSQASSIDKVLSAILSIGLKEVILYNNAAHPQFSGQILLDYREDPFHQLYVEYEMGHISLTASEIEMLAQLSNTILKYKHHAVRLGCIKDRPKLFLLKHIYCNHSINENKATHG